MRIPRRKGATSRSGLKGLGLESIRFDTAGLTRHPDHTPYEQYWLGPNVGISQHWFPSPPEVVGLEEGEIRGMYQTLLAEQGEVDGRAPRLLDVAVHRETPVPVVGTLIRGVMPDRYTFIGALTLLLAECSWVVKAQSSEGPITGMREALAFDRFAREQGVPGQSMEEMMSVFDPYEEQWDLDQQDPLTAVRQWMVSILASLEVDPEVGRATPFGS
jgi:hypothetical protein